MTRQKTLKTPTTDITKVIRSMPQTQHEDQRRKQRRKDIMSERSQHSQTKQQQQPYIRGRDLSPSYKLQVEEYRGLPVSLSCIKNESSKTLSTESMLLNDAGQQQTILNTTILFDYELALRDPTEGIVEVLYDELPSWEFFLLYYVAEDIGVIGCHIGNQNISDFSSSPSISSNRSIDIINLSSFGMDIVDTRIDSCQFLVDLEPGFICIPLQGIMTAEFVGQESDRSTVASYLAYHVATVVNNSDFLGAGIEHSSFIGSRVIPSPAPLPANETTTRDVDDNGSTSSISVALASTVSVAAFFFAFLLYFAVAKRRSRRTNTTEPAETASTDVTSKEVVVGNDSANTDMQPQRVTTNPTQSLDSTSDKSDDARCGSIDTVNRLGREVIDGSVTMEGAYALINARTVSTVVSTDDSDVYIEDDETAKVHNTENDKIVDAIAAASSEPTPVLASDSLPPKHPSMKTQIPPTAVAKAPKALRRKKKKKKKSIAAIVRSNSRENIKEMETITEVEEETSGDNIDADDGSDEDDGSWCSTSDSEAGSRDPSPARSSREPSPARSTSGMDIASTSTTAGIAETAQSLRPDATLATISGVGPSPDRTLGTDKPTTKKSRKASV